MIFNIDQRKENYNLSWIVGKTQPAAIIDYNKLFKETLQGELDEDVARKTFGKFLMTNIGMLVYLLTGYLLEPYQRIIIKGWMYKNFSLCVAGRSASKSFLAAHFAYIYCLFNPDHHVLITSATFRSSRRILENIEAWSEKKRNGIYPGGELLKETFARKMWKKPDMSRIIFKNGATITAVPLGDPDNLRGFRCNVLIIDEGLLIPQSTIDSVLKPFLAGGADVTRKQRIRKKEDQQIARGRRNENERTVFKSSSKMITLSSASYKWEELYATYKQYRTIIELDDQTKKDQVDDGVSSYLVQQISYKLLKPELMDSAVLKEIKEKLIPDNVIRREYEAQFIDESGGYFSAKEMNKCTIPMGMKPCIEIRGEAGAEYILGVDPSLGADKAGDHFAMCVLKIIERKDGRKIGLVVHQYGCAGVDLKHHISYLYYLIRSFNIIYICMDSTQGTNSDFMNICNESEYFKSRKMQLNPIEAEFTNANFSEIAQQVKKSYNSDSSVNRIVQQQYFSSAFIKAANEYMRAAFDQNALFFASHAKSIPNAVPIMCEQDVLGIHRTHPEYAEEEGSGNMYEFVNYQDSMIEQVKKECSMIEITASPLGNLTFDMPSHMTRNRKNENRLRKDNYSALLLANWALKIYLAAMEITVLPEEDSFTPRFVA